MASITGVYKITNIINGKCYIGQSINIHKRWAEHRRKNNNENTYLRKAIKKYGIYFFKFEVIVVCSRGLLDWYEKLAIAGNASIAPAGYNLSSGGRSTTWAYKPSEETLKKRSIALTGKIRTEETKRKMSENAKNRVCSEETKSKLRARRIGMPSWNKGTPMSEATKQKIIAAKLGKEAPYRWKQVIRSDGTIFKSIDQAAKATNCTAGGISRVLRGIRKLIYGYSFEYYGGVTSLQ
jgi:group I intron endonuclease